MDQNRIIEITSHSLLHLAKAGKISLDEKGRDMIITNCAMRGIEPAIVRDALAVIVIDFCNFSFGPDGNRLFQVSDKVEIPDEKSMHEIRFAIILDLLKRRRVRLCHEEMFGLVKEAMAFGIPQKDAEEYLHLLISRLVADAFK
jgi:hypothetical protein